MAAAKRKRPKVRSCRFCGCTDERGCSVPAPLGVVGCQWLYPDVCSVCAEVWERAYLVGLAIVPVNTLNGVRASLAIESADYFTLRRAHHHQQQW